MVSLSGNNGPYASLPDCDTLLPREVLDAIPGTDGERAEGEYRGPDDLDDASRPLENGPLGRLSCGADIRDGADALLVTVSIFEPHADDPEAADELTGFLADRSRERTEIWEEEAFDRLLDRPVGGWREIGVGEFGFVGLLDDTDRGSSSQVVVVEYVTDNLWVRTLYRTEDPQDEAESYRYAERFAQRLDRRIAREAEPAG
ncbi:hypothetical protein ABZ635_03345 [Nocardiopsis sp. NPDC007018]|uniref:hypothetical protein n=1 Tax=Nocardiopsis sp. NPDC007018 TaxID=3155721 RepID=UPI0033D28EBA